MLHRGRLLSLSLLLLCSAVGSSLAADGEAAIRIDPTRQLGPVNRRVFGHNLEAADSYRIFREDSHNYEPSTTGQGLWDPQKRELVETPLALTRALAPSVMRYPGGCLTHNFDWQATVGPVEDRPNFAFGLSEYLTLCKALDAEPLVTVSAYRCSPEQAAALVEYLNAPATPEHPWAQKRAAWAQEEPYGVRFFEMGNEADHGTHFLGIPKHTHESYCAWYAACHAAMKEVDPTISIAPHLATGKPPEDPWNPAILRTLKDRMEFVAIHTYYVGMAERDKDREDVDSARVLQACLAAESVVRDRMERYRRVIRENAGRDVPIAVTEFNAGFVQQKPIPYRFTLAAALLAVDCQRVFLEPESNVLMANYWQWFQGYWGTIRRHGAAEDGSPNYVLTPAYHLFKLWHEHFGETLVDTRIDSPTGGFAGYHHVPPTGGGRAEESVALRLVDGTDVDGYRWSHEDGGLAIDLTDFASDSYPPLGTASVDGGSVYRLTFEARRVGGREHGEILGLGLSDTRGWDKTHSACAAEGIETAGDWTSFAAEMPTLQDCTALNLVLRLRARGKPPVTTRIEVRNLRLVRLADRPPYAYVTGTGSLSRDGRRLYVILLNKHHAEAIPARLVLANDLAGAARFWSISGESPAVTNLADDGLRLLQGETTSAEDGTFLLTLPPHSMMAVEIDL